MSTLDIIYNHALLKTGNGATVSDFSLLWEDVFGFKLFFDILSVKKMGDIFASKIRASGGHFPPLSPPCYSLILPFNDKNICNTFFLTFSQTSKVRAS